MDEEDIQELYKWIDTIELSRPKRNISRDFSDGVLVAEVVKNFVPKLVELHNYQPASSQNQKMANWMTLNNKVLKKLDLVIPKNVLQGVVLMKPGVIEVVLNNLRLKLQQYLSAAPSDRPSQPHDDDYRELTPQSQSGGNKFRRRDRGGAGSTRLPDISSPDKRGGRGHAHTPAGGGGSGSGGSNNRGRDHREPKRAPMSMREREVDPYNLLADKEQELLESQETIEVLQVKVDKLTQLVQLKDRRIKDLQRLLNKR